MTDRIYPALTPEEWEDPPDLYDTLVRWETEELPRIIAFANHDLPDSHPNKFTREDVRVLREEGDDLVGYASDAETPEEWERQKHNGSVLLRLAARIEALLPPE